MTTKHNTTSVTVNTKLLQFLPIVILLATIAASWGTAKAEGSIQKEEIAQLRSDMEKTKENLLSKDMFDMYQKNQGNNFDHLEKKVDKLTDSIYEVLTHLKTK